MSKAKASLLKMKPDMTMIRDAIENLIDASQTFNVETIRDFLAKQFKISVDEMCSKSRKKTIAFPRQIAMYLSRKMTDNGLSDIGKAFNRDHSTVVHSVRVITESISRSASVRGQVEFLTDKLKKNFL